MEKETMIEQVMHNQQVMGMIIRHDYQAEGIRFLTPDDYSQQLAYMNHPAGKVIAAHVHNKVQRSIHITQEVLVIKRGRLRVDFYDENRNYLESRVLSEGDVILLVSGGHGFEVLEDVEMIEIKQGPYAGDNDKTRFEGIHADQAVIKEVR